MDSDGSNHLDGYPYSGSLSSRSSTPGDPYHHPSMYLAHSSSSSFSQGSDDWSMNSPITFPPNTFPYDQPTAPPACSQCIDLKRDKLVLATQNSTLKCVLYRHVYSPTEADSTEKPTMTCSRQLAPRSFWGRLKHPPTRVPPSRCSRLSPPSPRYSERITRTSSSGSFTSTRPTWIKRRASRVQR